MNTIAKIKSYTILTISHVYNDQFYVVRDMLISLLDGNDEIELLYMFLNKETEFDMLLYIFEKYEFAHISAVKIKRNKMIVDTVETFYDFQNRGLCTLAMKILSNIAFNLNLKSIMIYNMSATANGIAAGKCYVNGLSLSYPYVNINNISNGQTYRFLMPLELDDNVYRNGVYYFYPTDRN